MDELGNNIAHERTEMMSEGKVNPTEELRKRRSTRIVQAVPLVVTGVDALGRPFTERTSTLIINCHGCRYQSKHYVLKNMWVTLEIPHPETGQPPRTVRGRVTWIQRPRTVRQLFQVALELEVPGNVWGIAFPPEDWFPFPDAGPPERTETLEETSQAQPPVPAQEIHVPLAEPQLPTASGPDNLRVFPSLTSTTDASLHLARQVARLLADAKQQIHAAARDAASQAVAAERRVAFEEWEKKFAAARNEISSETARSIEQIQQESDARMHAAHTATAETLQKELPRWLAPQLEQLARELTAQLSKEGASQRTEQEQQFSGAAEKLQAVCRQAEETAARLRAQAEEAESQIAARADAAAHALDEAARQREEVAGSQRDALSAAASEIQQQVSSALSAAQASWQSNLASGLETAQSRWQNTIESALAAAQERAADSLHEQARTLVSQSQEEAGRQAAALRESAAGAAAESEQRLAELRNGLQAQAQRLEVALAQASESSEKLEHLSTRLEAVQQQALGGFQAQLEEALSLHRGELHGRSDSLVEDIHARIRATFEETNRQAIERFDEQIQSLVQPHVTRAEEAVHRLTGSRSLLDAALTLQQDRIRASADEAFAESLASFRENLGGIEQLLHESAQEITARNLADLESKTSDLKHQTIEELFKSAEWYEKKAQTQLQHLVEKDIEQASTQLREKAGELSSVFASELDHSSRNFLTHSQTQMDEIVRDAFERARALFAEAAETTSAAFTDEIQRNARGELDGFVAEVQKTAGESLTQMEEARAELGQKVTAEQEQFLRRFQTGMSGAVEAGVAEAHQKVQAGLAPLLESWKSMTDAHQVEMQNIYGRMSDQAAEQFRNRLENVSNSWMLATVTTLDHQSRDVVTGIAAAAEEKLRETCAQVFAGIGDTLRERLQQIAASFTPPPPPAAR